MNPRRSLFWVRRGYLVGEGELVVVVGAVDADDLFEDGEGHVEALPDEQFG